jgi:hypothetical protein
MDLQFQHDGWCNLGLLTAPILVDSYAYPMVASIHLSEISFDEILIVVLLQACLGGSAKYLEQV